MCVKCGLKKDHISKGQMSHFQEIAVGGRCKVKMTSMGIRILGQTYFSPLGPSESLAHWAWNSILLFEIEEPFLSITASPTYRVMDPLETLWRCRSFTLDKLPVYRRATSKMYLSSENVQKYCTVYSYMLFASHLAACFMAPAPG